MDEKQSEQPIKVSSREVAPDTESWYSYIWSAQQNVPDRLEDAAKFLATMISLSLTLFLAISGGKSAIADHPDFFWIKVAVICWIFSLIFSFLVLFPMSYRYVGESVQSIKDMHKRIVKRKRALLIVSLLLFLIALWLLIVVFVRG